MPVTAITTTLGLTSLIEVEWGYPGLWIPNHGIINMTPTTYDLAIKLFEYQCLKYIKVLAHLTVIIHYLTIVFIKKFLYTLLRLFFRIYYIT